MNPLQFKVGRRGAVTLQVSHVFVDSNLGTGQFFKFKLNGVQIKVQANPAPKMTLSMRYSIVKMAAAIAQMSDKKDVTGAASP